MSPYHVPTDELARWLIQHAARSAPADLAERLEEEWLADLETRRGAMARLRLGIGCCWATRVIACEHVTANVIVTNSATGNEAMAAYARHDDWLLSRRTIALLLIVGLHVVVIYALATGLTPRILEVLPDRMLAVVVPPVQTPREPPPPLDPPRLTTTKLGDVEPDVKFDFTPDTPPVDNVIAAPGNSTIPGPPTVSKAPVSRVPGGPGKGFPNTADYYPAMAIRLGQRGISTIQVCVDDRGRLTAPPTLVKSSGSPSLDAGAMKLAKAGSGHYRPTTEDGRPVSSCYPYLIRFDFND
jgi:periplasmic protein TonB